MAQQNATFLDEVMAAARGCVALVMGNRAAPSFFDFSQRGLVGSFIVLVVSLAVQAFGPQLLMTPAAPGVATSTVFIGALVIGIQFGVVWLVLRALGRGDGFVPFIVAFNWTAFFEALFAAAIAGIFGEPFTLIANEQGVEMAQLSAGALPLFILALVAIVIAINVGRLIVTLRPAHVALLIAAQVLAVLLSPVLLGMLMGPAVVS